MSFLDNLESSLNSLERQQERDPSEHQRREEDRARVLAAAPWAEKLKTSEFTKRLFDEAAREGHRLRTKIYMVWLDTTLRLEARERRLELHPTNEGINAETIEPDGTRQSRPVDLEGDAAQFIQEWLGRSERGKTSE